jgi:predicted transposase YdaD
MTDYRLRVYRRFPQKRMLQVVIYLRPTDSPLAYETAFRLENEELGEALLDFTAMADLEAWLNQN